MIAARALSRLGLITIVAALLPGGASWSQYSPPPPPPVLPYGQPQYPFPQYGQPQFPPQQQQFPPQQQFPMPQSPYGGQAVGGGYPGGGQPLPSFCCTNAGKLGPLYNPGIPAGGMCTAPTPYGQIPGQACY